MFRCQLVVFVVTADFGIIFSFVLNVLGGVLDLVLGVLVVLVLTISLLSWLLLGSGYLSCNSVFLGVFGPGQSMLLKDPTKFADPYFPMSAFVSKNSYRRGIGVRVKGVTGRDAIVAQ